MFANERKSRRFGVRDAANRQDTQRRYKAPEVLTLEAVGKTVDITHHASVTVPHLGPAEAVVVRNSPNCAAPGPRIREQRAGFMFAFLGMARKVCEAAGISHRLARGAPTTDLIPHLRRR